MWEAVVELWGAFSGLLWQIWAFLGVLGPVMLPWLPAGLWCAWCLWCINWEKTWPVLASGGWAVCVLLGLLAAIAWASVFPHNPNFYWQICAVGGLAVAGLFCGWLQGKLGWTPAEVTFAPPEPAHGHHHHHH